MMVHMSGAGTLALCMLCAHQQLLTKAHVVERLIILKDIGLHN